MQLYQPQEEGLDEFWVDFNIATTSMSLYAKDMHMPGGGGAEESDDMWESVIVKSDVVKDWSIRSEH